MPRPLRHWPWRTRGARRQKMFSLCDYYDYCSSIERPPDNINDILITLFCGPMHRIRLLGLLIFLYYTTFVAIRKVWSLTGSVKWRRWCKSKKEAADNWGSAAGAEEVKGYQLPERDRIVYHHYPPTLFAVERGNPSNLTYKISCFVIFSRKRTLVQRGPVYGIMESDCGRKERW